MVVMRMVLQVEVLQDTVQQAGKDRTSGPRVRLVVLAAEPAVTTAAMALEKGAVGEVVPFLRVLMASVQTQRQVKVPDSAVKALAGQTAVPTTVVLGTIVVAPAEVLVVAVAGAPDTALVARVLAAASGLLQ